MSSNQRLRLKEPGSDSIVSEFEMDDLESTPAAKYSTHTKPPSFLHRFNHYLSFVQTVGLPGVEYDEGRKAAPGVCS